MQSAAPYELSMIGDRFLQHPNPPTSPLALAPLLQPGPPLDLNTMADLFLQRNLVREATAFLLDVLQDNDPKNAVLQTKLLEINLVTNPQVR